MQIVQTVFALVQRCTMFSILLFGSFAVGLTACAHQDKKSGVEKQHMVDASQTVKHATLLKNPVEQWIDFASDVKTNYVRKTNVVFMRGKKFTQGKAINIFINGEYLTSLLPGGFKSTYVCSGNSHISVVETGTDVRYKNKNTPQYSFDLHGGEERYFQVIANKQGHPTVQPVAKKQARAILKKLQEQNHTISRVDKNKHCRPSS